MRSEGFSRTWPNLFSNTFATVGEFQQLLQSFVSIRFSQHDRTVTLIPNTSSSARSSSPPSPTHAFLTHQNFTNPSPYSQYFYVYEVAQSPHKNNMSGANTKSVLARFRDNNWENWRDFVKTVYFKNLMWEREGSASARWMTYLGFR